MNKRRLPDDRFKKKRQAIQKPGTFRLFLAIFPPEEYREYFRNILRELDKQKRNIRAVPVDQLHITVKYIGPEVSPRSKDLLISRLTSLQGQLPKPTIKLKQVQFGFSYQHDPVHILSELEDSSELLEFTNIVHSLLKDMGLDDTIRWKTKHADSFHITIGRTKSNVAKSIGREVKELVNKIDLPIPEPFNPEYIDVMESQITLTGPIYRKLARIRL